MKILFDVLIFINLILFCYLSITTLYIFVFAISGLFNIKRKSATNQVQRKFAIMIPGYKEDNVIYDVCKDVLNQKYPSHLFDVIAICDSYQSETINQLNTLPIKVIEVKFDLSTKAKALNKAMEILDDNYDIALILDADNLITDDFLFKINESFNSRFKAVQGHRVAKNTNTNFAILDAISEEINNHIFRKGTRNLGFSSAIIGSGMAFEYNMFKEIMMDVDAVGGFDKEIDLKMCKKRIKIDYIDDAICYDEKVQQAEVFQNQRRRWLSAQIIYFKKYFFDSIIHLFTEGNFDYFNKAFHTFLPPRILLLGITSIFAFISLFFLEYQTAINWLILYLLIVITFIISIPKSFYNKKTFFAISTLPKGFILMLLSLFKLKGANKKFLHTKHGIVKK